MKKIYDFLTTVFASITGFVVYLLGLIVISIVYVFFFCINSIIDTCRMTRDALRKIFEDIGDKIELYKKRSVLKKAIKNVDGKIEDILSKYVGDD